MDIQHNASGGARTWNLFHFSQFTTLPQRCPRFLQQRMGVDAQCQITHKFQTCSLSFLCILIGRFGRSLRFTGPFPFREEVTSNHENGTKHPPVETTNRPWNGFVNGVVKDVWKQRDFAGRCMSWWSRVFLEPFDEWWVEAGATAFSSFHQSFSCTYVSFKKKNNYTEKVEWLLFLSAWRRRIGLVSSSRCSL